MAEPTSCCADAPTYCARVDMLFNLAGVHDVAWLEAAGRAPARLRLLVETARTDTACSGCVAVDETDRSHDSVYGRQPSLQPASPSPRAAGTGPTTNELPTCPR
jgi:hypothetical protein